jgi:hypothetical protein
MQMRNTREYLPDRLSRYKISSAWAITHGSSTSDCEVLLLTSCERGVDFEVIISPDWADSYVLPAEDCHTSVLSPLDAGDNRLLV